MEMEYQVLINEENELQEGALILTDNGDYYLGTYGLLEDNSEEFKKETGYICVDDMCVIEDEVKSLSVQEGEEPIKLEGVTSEEKSKSIPECLVCTQYFVACEGGKLVVYSEIEGSVEGKIKIGEIE